MRSRSLEFPASGSSMQLSAPPSKQDVEILHYRIGRTLGEGTYGKVKLGVDTKTNAKVAIKSIKRENIKTERHLLRVTREIHALKLLGMLVGYNYLIRRAEAQPYLARTTSPQCLCNCCLYDENA